MKIYYSAVDRQGHWDIMQNIEGRDPTIYCTALPAWAAKDFSQLLNKTVRLVQSHIFDATRIIELANDMRFVTTEEQANEIRLSISRYDNYGVMAAIATYWGENRLLQLKQTVAALRNVQSSEGDRTIAKFLDFEPGTPLGTIYSYVQGEWGIDVELAVNTGEFKQLEYEEEDDD